MCIRDRYRDCPSFVNSQVSFKLLAMADSSSGMSVGAAPSPMVDGSSVGDASGVAAGVEDGFLPAEAEEAELLPVTVSSLLQPPARCV